MPWLILCIVTCLVASSGPVLAENCVDCHRLARVDRHRTLACSSCHENDRATLADPASRRHNARGCTGCHRGYERIFQQAMGTRTGEQAFIARTWGKDDPQFAALNCSGCHLQSCLDCHGGDGHSLGAPGDQRCLSCHRGYFVGSDYHGIAPREENNRYQRGRERFGQKGLVMASDVHAQQGISCSRCHSMGSLLAGRRSSVFCRDCHTPKKSVLEHAITEHLTRMECSACHSAWGAQEYGTFWLRFRESPSIDDFDLVTRNGEYLKSVYLKRQDAPPLGLNSRGLVSPIRPEFIAYGTDIVRNRPRYENRLLAAEWRPYFPHTIQRGAPFCDDCHDNPRRFLLEPPKDRIYNLLQSGMGLESFWDRRGQTIREGAFMPVDRVAKLSGRSAAYRKAYVKKWQQFSKPGAGS